MQVMILQRATGVCFFVRCRLGEQLGMNEQGCPMAPASLAWANRTALTKFCVTSSISIIHAFLTNFLSISPTTSTFMTQQHLLNIKSINT
jgi:hypothetical protein